MRLGILLITITACTAIDPLNVSQSQGARSIVSTLATWFSSIQTFALKVLLGSSKSLFLTAPMRTLEELDIYRPRARQAGVADVPQTHVVVFGAGGVLPDFNGPFSVDTVYISKEWGGSVYDAVWVGYFNDVKLAVGVNADITYSDICRFLATEQRHRAARVCIPSVGHFIRRVISVFEDGVQLLVKRLVFAARQSLLSEAPRLDGIAQYLLYYWLHWAIRWNLFRAACLPWTPRQRASQRRRLRRDTLGHHSGYSLAKKIETAVFATPADMARALFTVISTPLHANVLWHTVFLSHRCAVLRSCACASRRLALCSQSSSK